MCKIYNVVLLLKSFEMLQTMATHLYAALEFECVTVQGGVIHFPFVFPRLSRYQQFKDFQRRILVATNLFGRGMDIERVNIVFNYDMPEDSDTYLHRVSRGVAIEGSIACHSVPWEEFF